MKRNILLIMLVDSLPAWADEIKDVKPPVDLPPNYFWLYLILTLAGVALCWFVGRLIVRVLRDKRNAALAPLPSWETALQAFKKLESEKLFQQGRTNEYYTRLSNILRRYIEERFDIRAPEMTTEEFLGRLKGISDFSVSHKESLKDFLNYSDMVKFAKHSPTEQEMIKSMELAKKFVEETKPAPASVSS